MSKIYKNFSVLMMIYIIIQPILDVITGFMVKSGSSESITVGILVRMLVMILMFGFIAINKSKLSHKESNRLIVYFSLLALVLLINLVVSYKMKPVFSPIVELSAIAKTLYYIIMLIGYFIVFDDLFKQKIVNDLYPKVVFFAILIVDFVMIVAHFTKTSFNAYDWMKAGESGWFYAANEIGSLLAIALPLVILYAVNKMSSLKNWYYWLAVIFTIYSCLLLGTKVGVIAIVGTLVLATAVSVAKIIQTSGKSKKWIAILVALVLTTGGVMFAYPRMAASQNIKIQKMYVKEQRKKAKYVKYLLGKKHLTAKEKAYLKKLPKGQKEILKDDEVKDTTKSLIFSSRTVYLSRLQKFYQKAPIAQKAFGMGLGGNYKKDKRSAEMDYFDIYFQFGFVGFILTILPLLLSVLSVTIYTLKHIKIVFTFKYSMLWASLGLGLFIALLSGHVIVSPAVSIYLVTVLAYMVIDFKNRNEYEKNIEIDD